VLLVKYEDLLADTKGELERLAVFLGVRVSDEALHDISVNYSRASMKNEENITNKTHFNKAISSRYLTEMTEREIEYCRDHFGSYLLRMGYSTADGA